MPCLFRSLCEGLRLASCHPQAQGDMRAAIEACTGAECFVIFGRKRQS